MQYVVQTTHRGFFFICLACYYVSTEVLGTENSSRLVSALVRQSRSTRHGKLIAACSSFVQRVSTLVTQYSIQTLTMTCLFAQYVSAVVLDTENSSRLVVHLFSALGRQYCSTWYRQLITGCSTFVYWAGTLVLLYLVRTTHHGLFYICLVPLYVSIVVLGTDANNGIFICLVRQYRSSRDGQLITACS